MSKERLIKLLRGFEFKCPKDCLSVNYKDCNKCKLEQFADYLLASGEVIVLPCKVGDTVWFIEQGICFGDKRISKGFVSRFDIRELPGLGLTHNVVIVPRDAIDNRMRFSLFECFNQEYYTSREEAEAKLRKEDEGK